MGIHQQLKIKFAKNLKRN